MKTLNLKLTGIAPILFHSGRLSDPLDPAAKEIKKVTSKKAKTDADHEQIAKLEWHASMYTQNGEVVLPGDMVFAAVINGAKQDKRGPKAKAGIIVDRNFPLIYDGPKSLQELFEIKDFVHRCPVKIGTSKTIRTRPIFHKWAASVQIDFEPSVLNEDEVLTACEKAGMLIGFGDWRPRFGRFRVEKT